MKNEIIVIKDDEEKKYQLPAFGTVIIRVHEGKPVMVETTEKNKI